MQRKIVPVTLSLCCVLVALALCISTACAQGKQSSAYLDGAARIIQDNNRIDACMAETLQDALLRPIHRIQRLQKASEDACALWPAVFDKNVPDEYADLSTNLEKLVRLQMQRTCLIYDAEYTAWMENSDREIQYREKLKEIDKIYVKQKVLTCWVYDRVKK